MAKRARSRSIEHQLLLAQSGLFRYAHFTTEAAREPYMPDFLRRLSIRNKLMLSMACCLLLFLVVSATLSVVMTGNGIRERVVTQELPAEIGEIRNDIQRQISEPLAAALSISANTFLLNWEKAGLPDSGQDAWRPTRHAPQHRRGSGVVGVGVDRQILRRQGL
jgi:methyl-accepting chemotaxis protein